MWDSQVPVTQGPEMWDAQVPVTQGPNMWDSQVPVTQGPKMWDSQVPVTQGPKMWDSQVPVTQGPEMWDSKYLSKLHDICITANLGMILKSVTRKLFMSVCLRSKLYSFNKCLISM